MKTPWSRDFMLSEEIPINESISLTFSFSNMVSGLTTAVMRGMMTVTLKVSSSALKNIRTQSSTTLCFCLLLNTILNFLNTFIVV